MFRSIATRELLLVVLRLLEERAMTAGELLEELERLLSPEARIRPGAVLIALSSLEAEGLVRVAAADGPAVYRVTPRGSEEVARRADVSVPSGDRRPGRFGPSLPGRRRSRPSPAPEIEQVAVMFTDVVGSTELLDRFGDDEAHELRRRHFGLLRGAVRDHRGREVKNLGDGLMVVFQSPPTAAACGLEMQRAVASAEDPLQLRVGIAAGETVREDDDHFGRPVVVAKRLCDVADPGAVLVSGPVRSLLPDTAVESEQLGPLTLKGLSEPVTTTLLRARPLTAAG
ncbi:MAG TPA: adenylate/guanylate cyclase domain-containing protein [Solirubrobacterales bacterium]|nr:adenylate/guanylate cyclase domain-containing protein [Solirubrobacterales bacterium]